MMLDAQGRSQQGPLLLSDGRVVATGEKATQLSRSAPLAQGLRRIRLPGCILVPGFANAHSHAFQRALRGRVETRQKTAPHDDFWSWRHEMYRIALTLDLDAVEAVATWCYADMVRAGFVSVGEFHYLHHDTAGQRYADPAAVSARLARAAQRAGVRLVLLQCAYERAGWGQQAHPEQRRFIFPDVKEFLQFCDDIRSGLPFTGTGHASFPDLRHGFALHSVRACSGEWLEAVSEAARGLDLPLHIHACEQPAELKACQSAEGMGPIAFLSSCGALHSRTTLVHATHVSQSDIQLMVDGQTYICLCPSTERNLGDGLAPILDFQRAGIPVCVGTDSHARIDALDELRSLEEHERVRLLRRNVLAAPGESPAPALLHAGCIAGAQSLGLSAPGIEPGAPADFVAFTIPPESMGSAERAFDALWVAGNARSDVHTVIVAGSCVYERSVGQQAILDPILPTLRRVLESL